MFLFCPFLFPSLIVGFLFTCPTLAAQSPSPPPSSVSYVEPAPPPRYPGAVPVAQLLGSMPVYREIRDWILACDNIKACVARYVSAKDGAQGPGYFSLTREAEPDGKLRIILLANESPKAPNPRQFRLDGKAVESYPWKVLEKKGRDGRVVLDSDAALKFARAVEDGQILSFSGKRGAPYIPLDGMKAALSAMDDVQGRLGSDTALERSGPKPSSAVPAAPALPVIYAKPTKAVLAHPKRFAAAVRRANADLLEQHVCDPSRAAQDRAFALDSQQVLVFLGCDVGAYYVSNVLFLAPRGAPDKALLLVLPLQPGKSPAGVSVESAGAYNWNYSNPDRHWNGWDGKTATFSEREKGRGLADCGDRSAWTFDGQVFQLTRYDSLARCGGGPEQDWPTLYRTQVLVK